MSIPARWSGYCSECGERWQPGDPIRSVVVGYEHMERWVHDACPDVPDPDHRADREPCDDCTWVEVQAMCEPEPRLILDHACPKHGGNQ